MKRSIQLRALIVVAASMICAGWPVAAAEKAAVSKPPASLPLMPTRIPTANWQQLPAHPRLFADAARFATLKTQGDEVSRQLLALLRSQADQQHKAI